MLTRAVSSYDAVASEYYDPVRHPTCDNFREASRALIELMAPGDISKCCEVGAGDSILAEVAVRRHGNANGLLLTDASASMLQHSSRWQRHGARLAVARADHLPVRDGELQLIVASLADPYDDDAFWYEVARVLGGGGFCLLTTPSWEWVQSFRTGGRPLDVAEFKLADGEVVSVRSFIRHPSDEHTLIERHGFRVVGEAAIALEKIRGPLSKKLKLLGSGSPVVIGYLATRLR